MWLYAFTYMHIGIYRGSYAIEWAVVADETFIFDMTIYRRRAEK